MTPTERISAIETLELMEKHKDFAKKIGLIDTTKVEINERRTDMLTKENSKQTANHEDRKKDLNIVQITICKGAGCIACDNPTYPDCIDSCPLFDN